MNFINSNSSALILLIGWPEEVSAGIFAFSANLKSYLHSDFERGFVLVSGEKKTPWKEHKLWGSASEPSTLLNSCVALGTFLIFSESQFPHL